MMFVSNKRRTLAVLVTIISMMNNTYPQQEQSNTQEQQIQPVLVVYAQQINKAYENVSQQCERLYNPVGILGTSAISAVLGVRRLAFVAIATVAIAHSDLIIEYIKENMSDVEKQNNENESTAPNNSSSNSQQ